MNYRLTPDEFRRRTLRRRKRPRRSG